MDQPPIDRLCESFRLGKPAGPAAWAARGEMGEVWRFDTDKGGFALKRLFTWARDDRAEIEARAVDGAIAGGIATPSILRTQERAVVAALAGERWRVFSWMDFGPPFPRPALPADARDVGTLLGRLHGLQLAAEDLEVIPWFTARRGADDWRALQRRGRRDQAAWADQFEAALDDILDLLDVVDPGGLSGRRLLSHCDLTPENVRRRDGAGLVVIDWEHAGATPPSWELALMLYMWTPPLDDPALAATARALAEGYRSADGDLAGLARASFAGAVSAQLNWILNRLYTSLAGPNPDDRARAALQVPELLAGRLTTRRIAALLDAAHGR